MSIDLNQVFASAVDQSLKEWKSFQLCVDHGMGGQQTNEKLVWMTETIVDFFNSNKDLDVEEVADFVAEIVDNEFDTVFEDGSLRVFAANICRYYRLCSSGRLREVVDRIEEIRQRNERVSDQTSGQQNQSESESQMSVETQMKSLNITSDSNSEDTSEPAEESDGWTRVQRRHRK